MLPFKPDFENCKEKPKIKEFFDFALVNYLIKTTVGTVNNILVDSLGNNRGI